MRTLRRGLGFCTVFALLGLAVWAQGGAGAGSRPTGGPSTTGIGEVVAVEDLARRHRETMKSIGQRKQELAGLEKAHRANIDRLRDELAALERERDARIRDLKGGFFCSKCGRLKSDFEKAGESFEKHLDDVTGVAIPAPTERLEALREEYRQKIAYKRVQIQKAEAGDEASRRKRQELADLQAKLAGIAEEILKRSRAYDRTVQAETVNKQLGWIRDLIDHASDILIAQDKIDLHEARLAALEKEFQLRAAETREEVRQRNLDERRSRQERLDNVVRELNRRRYDQDEALGRLEAQEAELAARIAAIDARLRMTGVPEEERRTLEAERAVRLTEQAGIAKAIRAATEERARRIARLDEEKARLDEEIAELRAALPGAEDAAVARIKAGFDRRRDSVAAALALAREQLPAARAAYREREAHYTKENSRFFELVAAESNRMVVAARDVGCTVSNEARGFVAGNWNKLLPGVAMAANKAKPYSTDVFGSYLPPEVRAGAFSRYKSFLAGLSPEDLAVVKAGGNTGWYEALFAPVSDAKR